MLQRTTRQKTMTDAQKGKIISMYFDGNVPIQNICEAVNCSRPTVYKWIRKFEADGNVCRKKPPGRPNITTPAQDASIVQAVVDNPFSYVKEIAQEHEVGYNTALRRIKKVGIHRRRAARRTYLNRRVRDERMRFCRLMLSAEYKNDWSNIIFTDEKTFCSDHKSVKYVYRPNNQRFNEKYVSHGTRSGRTSVNYWGYMTSTGLGEIYETPKKHNSDSYITVLNDFVIGLPVLAGPVNRLIFQQDNSSVHTSIQSTEFINTLGFKRILVWPSISPDLNLIEHIWAAMEKMRPNERPRNQDELRLMVQKIWDDLRTNTELIQHLYDSLERRFKYVLEHDGDWCV